MARATRTNVMLTLGLISTPVSIVTALEAPDEAKLNTLCNAKHDPVKCKQRLYCPSCDNDDRSSFVRGKDMGDGSFVIVDTATVAAVSESDKNTITLTTHPAGDLAEALPGGKAYFLVPQKGTGEAYPLLIEMIRRHPEYAFVCTFAVKSVPAMYRLGVRGNALTLTELAWPETVRAVDGGNLPLNEALVPLAERFIQDLAVPFDPANYTDDRAAALRNFYESAQRVKAGSAPDDTPVPAVAGNAADLLAALETAVRMRGPAAADLTKAELADKAKALGIKGRSRMSREQLIEAVEANA